jgi:N-carbamoylputrescine amidase
MKPSSVLKAGLVQHAVGADLAATRALTEQGIRDAADRGARLVLLQELHQSSYFCKVEDPDLFDLAEAIPGPGTEWLGGLARELSVVIVGSLFERRAAGIYHNTAVVLEADGTLAGRYRKAHIPDDPAYYEKFYFTPGDDDLRPIQTSVGRLGVLVCWDQWYPEAARLMALAGADLLLYPTAIGRSAEDPEAEQRRQQEAWEIVQRGHAVANGLAVLACNRVGYEPDPSGATSGITFWGNTFACGPQGEVLARAGDAAETLVVNVDLGRSERVRRMWPFLRDRRIDAYADLLLRYRD